MTLIVIGSGLIWYYRYKISIAFRFSPPFHVSIVIEFHLHREESSAIANVKDPTMAR